MIKVWHAKVPTFGLSEQNFPADYELVAEVDTNDVEYAYKLTNHIDCPWWENREVKAIKQTRSTSVGDVLEVNGKFHRCEMAGWIAVVPS